MIQAIVFFPLIGALIAGLLGRIIGHRTSEYITTGLLIAAAVGFAFFANLLRSLFLTAWAYAYGSGAIEGPIHDWTGLAVLGVTVVGLFALLPLFKPTTWRWLRSGRAAAGADRT